MFDISFSELALCFIVALVVLGPERLPKVARTVGRWSGHLKSYMRNITTELERETDVMDLKRQFNEARQALLDSKKEIEDSSRRIASDVQNNIRPPIEHGPVEVVSDKPAIEPPVQEPPRQP